MQVRYYQRPQNPSQFVEGLQAGLSQGSAAAPVQEPDEEQAQQTANTLDEQRYREGVGRIKTAAWEMGKDRLKKEVKKKVVQTTMRALFFTPPYVGWIIVGIVLVLLLLLGVITTVVGAVNTSCQHQHDEGWLKWVSTGAVRTASYAAEKTIYFADYAICKDIPPMDLKTGSNLATQAAEVTRPDGPPVPPGPNPLGLVAITGIPVDTVQTRDPRLRQCMLDRLLLVYKEFKTRVTAPGVDVWVTSAYRAGSVVDDTGGMSAHDRGEAVDLVIRPHLDWRTNKTFAGYITILVGAARANGFNPVAGDTLDEYRKPTSGATGGHVHLEFNLDKRSGQSYCDTTTI